MIPEPGHTELNFVDFIILLGVVQGILLTITCLFRKKREEKFKAALFFSITCIIAEIFLNRTGYMYFTIPLVDFSEPLQFSIPPLTYLLVLSINPDIKLKNWGLHFIPFVAYILFFIPFYLAPYELKFESYYYVHHFVEWKTSGHYELYAKLNKFRQFQMFIWYFQTIIYLVLNFQVLKRYRQTLHGTNRYEINGWLAFNIIIATLVIVILVVKMTYFRDIGDHIIATFLTFIVYCSTFTELLRQEAMVQTLPSKSIEEVSVKKYGSAIKEEKKTEISEKLLLVMNEKKLYTNNLISVGKLAKILGEPAYLISLVINEKMKLSFYDWIAKLRVEEAKLLLTSPKTNQYTIEQIAEEVGYNSKSAFNKAFKKFTGQTPSEFKTNINTTS
jgi:AraC-like DNA-binding protein